MIIDTTYDVRTDANGKDPDIFSATLRKYHKTLWSKLLPNGQFFELKDDMQGIYLYHKSWLGEFYVSSDSVIPWFSRWKRLSHIIDQIPEEDIELFRKIGYTIGGMMIFPSNKIDGKPTINGERGFNRKIVDRMDLTLECIKRYYSGEDSPMSETLQRYNKFFNLFNNFKGYIDFFLLNDLVTEDYSAINFFLPNNNFNTSPLPSNLEEYIQYRTASIKFIKDRNQRISNTQMTK